MWDGRKKVLFSFCRFLWSWIFSDKVKTSFYGRRNIVFNIRTSLRAASTSCRMLDEQVKLELGNASLSELEWVNAGKDAREFLSCSNWASHVVKLGQNVLWCFVIVSSVSRHTRIFNPTKYPIKFYGFSFTFVPHLPDLWDVIMSRPQEANEIQNRTRESKKKSSHVIESSPNAAKKLRVDSSVIEEWNFRGERWKTISSLFSFIRLCTSSSGARWEARRRVPQCNIFLK